MKILAPANNFHFWNKFTKNTSSRKKKKKWTSQLNFSYSNRFEDNIILEGDNFSFLDQICWKRLFVAKNGKAEHHHWILQIQISPVTKFQSKLITLIFLYQTYSESIFPIKNRKSERQHQILHIQTICSTKFQLKLTILFFWTKFP